MDKLIPLLLICLLNSGIKGIAQRLLIIDDYFGILTIDSCTQISIKAKYQVATTVSGVGQVYQFVMDDDSIKSRTLSYNPEEPSDSTFISGITYFPSDIKVRNNQYEHSYIDQNAAISSGMKADSLVFDGSGNVIERYNRIPDYPYVTLFSKFIYLYDSVIIEINPATPESTVYRYELDSQKNILSIAEASFEIKTDYHLLDFDNIAYRTVTKFIYDNVRNRVLRIEIYEKTPEGSKLTTVQCFKYKRGRPISSYVKDEKIGKVIYKQEYEYSRR